MLMLLVDQLIARLLFGTSERVGSEVDFVDDHSGIPAPSLWGSSQALLGKPMMFVIHPPENT